jgi:hypothetical protein
MTKRPLIKKKQKKKLKLIEKHKAKNKIKPQGVAKFKNLKKNYKKKN